MSKNNLGFILMESAEEARDHKVIKEEANGKLIAEGYLQTELNVKNRNGRIYGTPGIKKEVEGPRIKELKETGNLKGENGHPSDPSLSVQQTINPEKVCVKYLDVWMEGDNVKARYCGTNDPRGQAFNEDLACGEKPSFSLRALGSVASRGGAIYVDNVKIVTWDRVYYPSHKKAYTTNLVSESTQLYRKEASINLTESGIMIPITTNSVRDFIKHESYNMHKIMESFDTIFDSMTLVENGQYVQIVTKEAETLMICLEDYVQNQILNFCTKRY